MCIIITDTQASIFVYSDFLCIILIDIQAGLHSIKFKCTDYGLGKVFNNSFRLLHLTLYIIYKIKVMFLQNWYPRETSLLFTGRQMLCSMSVRKCIRFCIPELQSWPEVKNTNMKFMKIQDKNTQISVYCIQHYCK